MRLALFLPGLLLAGCDDTTFGGAGGTVEGSGYTAVTAVLDQSCASCHSAASKFGGLDLETDPCGTLVGKDATGYSAKLVAPGDHEASVLWNKVAFTDVYGGGMPTGGQMAQENVDIIAEWIDDGADCDSTGGGDSGGGDSGGGDTGPVDTFTFEAVQDEVFTPSCSGCHTDSTYSSAAGLTLAEGVSYAAIVGVEGSTGDILVDPGDPEGSYLYLKMLGQGSAGTEMPPGNSVADDKLNLVHGWILAGAEE